MNKDPLLEKVHKNTRTGLFTVPKIKELVTDRRFREELSIEETEYRNLYASVEEISGNRSYQIGPLAKLRSSLMIRIGGNDTSKQAQMLILGSTMGMVDVTRAIRRNPTAPHSSKQLAADFLAVQERNVEILRQYL